jgi:hypothetical protein
VFVELTASKRDLPPAIDLASEPRLMVASATGQQRVQELRENLDPGEAEAIVRAIELEVKHDGIKAGPASCNRPCLGAKVDSCVGNRPATVQKLRENLDPSEAESARDSPSESAYDKTCQRPRRKLLRLSLLCRLETSN